MNQKFCLPVCFAIVVVIILSCFYSPSVAQPDVANTKQVGRYQLEIVPRTPTTNPFAIVVDTTSGRCWKREVDLIVQWKDLGSPVLMMKKEAQK